MSTIRNTDVADTETNPSEEFDGTSAFLANLEGKEEDASKKKPSEEDEEDQEQDAPEGDDEDQEGSEETPETDEEDGEPEDDQEGKDKKYAEDDGVFVKIKEGETEHEVPLKDLKRLFGQEAALTRKSQEVAAARTAAETKAQTHASALQVLLTRAQEKSAPYKKIDWMAVSKDPNITAEEASHLRAAAQHALEEEQFLSQNLDGFMQEVNKQQHETRIASAKECVKALTNPGTKEAPNSLHIEGWNDKVYNDVRAFGIKMGAPEEFVNTLIDPAGIKMMHMAMLFAKGASKVTTTKVNKTPKKIVKTSSSPVTRDAKPAADRKAAIKNLRNNPNKSGAAADAFYASFGIDDSE